MLGSKRTGDSAIRLVGLAAHSNPGWTKSLSARRWIRGVTACSTEIARASGGGTSEPHAHVAWTCRSRPRALPWRVDHQGPCRRRTKDGHVVVFVVNARGQLRSYRADRIAGVSVTREPFQPRFRIEFWPSLGRFCAHALDAWTSAVPLGRPGDIAIHAGVVIPEPDK